MDRSQTDQLPRQALATFAAVDVEGHDELVALLPFVVRRARLDHLAHEFMAEHVATLHGGHQAIHEMEVGATDGAGRDLDDDVARILDLRIGDVIAANIVGAVPAESFHLDFPFQVARAISTTWIVTAVRRSMQADDFRSQVATKATSFRPCSSMLLAWTISVLNWTVGVRSRGCVGHALHLYQRLGSGETTINCGPAGPFAELSQTIRQC